MAKVILKKQISTDEIKQLLEKKFPSYVFEKKSSFLIECNTGISSRINIRNSGFNIHISHKISPILAFWLGFTVIGAILYFATSNKDPKLLALVNFLKENQDNSKIPKNIVAEIPKICPNCKSPNTKKIQLCEWCGNQII